MTKGIVESFEVTEGGMSGDLLTQKRQEKKFLVGLLTCAYFDTGGCTRVCGFRSKGTCRL